MKKLLFIILSFCWVLAKGQCPNIQVTLKNPTTSTANWGMGTSVFQITVSGSGRAMEMLTGSQVLVTIKDGNGIVCRGNKIPSDITGQTPVKNWSGAAANALLGQQECILKPGTYTICVEFYGKKYNAAQQMQEEMLCDNHCATVFTISDVCSPPVNVNPTDKKIFTDKDILKPISFNWSPVIAGNRGLITYRLFVWEIEEGQTSAQAIYNNAPVIQQDIKGQTRYTAMPGVFEKRDADYVWRVIALDEKDEPICRNAQSEATHFSVRVPIQKKQQPDSVLNTPCGNGDFESAALDPLEWSAGYTKLSGGNNSTFSPPFNNTMQPANGNPVDAPINAGCGNQANENHQVIVSAGFDPMVPTLNRVPASTISNKYALRLGNNCPGCGTERIQKKFLVTAANTSYKFMYALVVQAPHGLIDNPSLWVRVFNSSGAAIPGLVYLDPQNPSPMDRAVSDLANPYWKIYKKDNNSENDVLYREWACARIDLSSVVGQVVTVEILTNDCAQCGHYGYAYLDNFCIGCDNNPPPSDCCSSTINNVSDRVTVLAGNMVNLQQEFNISPTNIKQLTAEIISVEEDPIDTTCMKCGPKDKWAYQFISHNTSSWNSATALNASPVNSTAYYPAHKIEWHCNKQGNLKFSLKIALPGNAPGCTRKSKICIRYSFIDIDCRACEKIICYTVDSQ
ncbi:MAG: hypothetical protein WBO46_07080 [Caldilineaceae bacterium]